MANYKLNEKQLRFVDAYMGGKQTAGNATQSAKVAGYTGKDPTLGVTGANLLKNPKVVAEINKRRAERVAASNYDAAWVLNKLALLANFNISKFIRHQDDGTAVYDFSTATEDDWYCIHEYATETIGKNLGSGNIIEVDKLKLKSVDKLKALELLGKHVGVQAFKERVEVGLDEDLAKMMSRARSRVVGSE